MSEFEGKTLFVDYNKCIGCEACEAVCKFLYSNPRIVMLRSNTGMVRPLYCMHCEPAFCMRACPQGALSRDSDGAVILDHMRCRGCLTMNCLLACPYAAFFSTGKSVLVDKCDLCKSRRKHGLGPACVEMCPCGAIKLVRREDLNSLKTEEWEKTYRQVLEFVRPSAGKGDKKDSSEE